MNASLSDTIYALDRRQNTPKAVVCGRDVQHGRLTAHGNGQHLICGCGYAIQVDAQTVAEALAEADGYAKAAETLREEVLQ